MITSPDPAHPRRFALRMTMAAFGVGLLLSLTTSGGIAEERVTCGAFDVALVANAAATLAALLAVVPTMRRTLVSFAELRDHDEGRARVFRLHPLALFVPHLLGAAAGIVVVHLWLRHEVLSALPWLSERPAQFVNDIVAVSGLLALVWAAANGLDARFLVLAFAGVTLYRFTSPMWHLDHAPNGFQSSVQELVVAQFVGAAVALGLFRASLDRAAQ
jgi:hypothetical protein